MYKEATLFEFTSTDVLISDGLSNHVCPLPGDSLGKSSHGGLTAPIPICVKTTRGGLGRDALVKEIKRKKEEMIKNRRERKQNHQQMSTEEYR